MSDRPALERVISDTRRSITQVERDMRQLRDWLATNERNVAAMPDSLRRITEDGIVRARSDLALREQEARQLRDTLAAQERRLALMNEIERRTREIQGLEREQERIFVLLEKQRAELRQFQASYEAIAGPIAVAPCEFVLPNNARMPLDAQRGAYMIGWGDGGGQRTPDIDLAPFGGGSLGVSRAHAILRFRNGQWDIEDLGSTNGTFLNDHQLQPRVPTALADKTTVRLGSLKLFFRYITQTTRL